MNEKLAESIRNQGKHTKITKIEIVVRSREFVFCCASGLDTAMTLRKQQASQFTVEEGELENSTEAVSDAAATLSSNGSSLLQIPKVGKLEYSRRSVFMKTPEIMPTREVQQS